MDGGVKAGVQRTGKGGLPPAVDHPMAVAYMCPHRVVAQAVSFPAPTDRKQNYFLEYAMFRHLLFLFFFLAATSAPCFAGEPAGPGKPLTREEALEVIFQFQKKAIAFMKEDSEYFEYFQALLVSNTLSKKDAFYVSQMFSAVSVYHCNVLKFLDATVNYRVQLFAINGAAGGGGFNDSIVSGLAKQVSDSAQQLEGFADDISDDGARVRSKGFVKSCLAISTALTDTYSKLVSKQEERSAVLSGPQYQAMASLRLGVVDNFNAVYAEFVALAKEDKLANFDSVVLSMHMTGSIVNYLQSLEGLRYLCSALHIRDKYSANMPQDLARPIILRLIRERNENAMIENKDMHAFCQNAPEKMGAACQKLIEIVERAEVQRISIQKTIAE